MPERLVDSIKDPTDVRRLALADLQKLASELREELINVISTCGGHFASSLGATELTLALHYSFNTPEDKLVWDVGHQAYVHKMITGRREKLPTIRQAGGISGFLKREESIYDTFGAGHAGTSVSAAVGMAVAEQKKQTNNYAVAIVGDGSMTAGMIFEALNNGGDLKLPNLVVVLNDNQMSISPNVGALKWFFSRALTAAPTNWAREKIKELKRAGLLPEILYKALDRAESAVQGFIASPAAFFQAFGFRYIGPVDGHDIASLIKAFEHAKIQRVPTLVHTYTQKGKGYEPAENDPLTWHGVTPFDRKAGQFKSSIAKPVLNYSQAFALSVAEMARRDDCVVAITAAMPTGTGLDKFAEEFPDRFFDVGICEQHAVTFAAALAAEGLKPICAIYSTFLQRAYDQIVHDVCIQKLPVIFALDRGGLVGNDGETHQGVFDIAFLRALPNIVLLSPKDEGELREMLWFALKLERPVAIRYPRGSGVGVDLNLPIKGDIQLGRGEVLIEGSEVGLLAYGPSVQTAFKAASDINRQNCSNLVGVVNARFVKPLDRELLIECAERYRVILTMEDHSLVGGFGGAVLECLADLTESGLVKKFPEVIRIGVEDRFVPHGTQAEQLKWNGMDLESISKIILSKLGKTSRLALAAV
ncbi:MAG TPA: 1-deoxy-D-xylulose-5-phosphate synthase [Oligoflexia bacterium]|nr:1-deoxy-D-xylulose-5-phosphate synthase [Oligoflexia bacterium]HMP27178.1 1-deoxy-D-xylulose-5-phosphate synthase [Oligoflexia bacterium]